MTWVGVLAYEGVEELDLAGVVAPLTKAAQCTQHNSGLRVLTAGPAPEVTGSNGLVIGGLRTLAALSSCAAVVLPGGRGAEEAAASPLLRQTVAEAAARGPRCSPSAPALCWWPLPGCRPGAWPSTAASRICCGS